MDLREEAKLEVTLRSMAHGDGGRRRHLENIDIIITNKKKAVSNISMFIDWFDDYLRCLEAGEIDLANPKHAYSAC